MSKDQQAKVKDVICPETFHEYPVHSNVVKHDIVLKSDAIVIHMSYRIPEHLSLSLKKEMSLILSLRAIKPSKSEWCALVVLVPNKIGTKRFCIDFRYLNSVSKFDSYPTPQIADLV